LPCSAENGKALPQINSITTLMTTTRPFCRSAAKK
jgi:hypothetical protein